MTVFDASGYSELFRDIAAVRAHRAEFLAAVKAGEVLLAEIFERGAHDPVLGSMKVLPAVEGLPEAGKVQTRRAFEELEIDEAALINDVTTEMVATLPAALERHAL